MTRDLRQVPPLKVNENGDRTSKAPPPQEEYGADGGSGTVNLFTSVPRQS